jgi:putative phosphoesterase
VRTIGVISDTHGLLRDEAVEALEGSDLILHAGDVGGPEILERLALIAPLAVVRGNTDYGEAAGTWPATDLVSLGDESRSVFAYLLHDIGLLDLDPVAAGVAVVVYGHSHRPAMERRDGVLYFNPGAAGHRRFTLPVTVGRLLIGDDGGVSGEIIDLEV